MSVDSSQTQWPGEANGHEVPGRDSPTAIEIDGIVFDLNRITRKEYARGMRQIQVLTPAETKEGEPEPELSEQDAEKIQELSGQLYAQIITAWPFSQPLTVEGYLNLGMMDSARVDEAFTRLGQILQEKKLARMSTYLENTNSPYPIPLQPTNTPA
jgi:hypothetical protein